jgi:5'-nucleotidase
VRILLTNDDGIASVGITLLAKALRDAGHRVFVIAPDSERSGFSNAISFLNDPCKITEIEKDTWICSGTPADCVICGLLGGIPPLTMVDDHGAALQGQGPDLVLSGINRGANLGTDINYSGTAAAARQGGLLGIPSVALSLVEGSPWHWEAAVSFSVEHLQEMRNYWKAGTFVNVNFPNISEGAHSLFPAFPSVRYYNDRIETYRAPAGSLYCFPKAGKVQTRPEDGSDWDIVSKKMAAMTSVLVQPAALEKPQGRDDGSGTPQEP